MMLAGYVAACTQNRTIVFFVFVIVRAYVRADPDRRAGDEIRPAESKQQTVTPFPLLFLHCRVNKNAACNGSY